MEGPEPDFIEDDEVIEKILMVALGTLILMVHSPFPERLNQSCQGMVDAGDTKPKNFTISVPGIPNPP
jgi:hypothetical protein